MNALKAPKVSFKIPPRRRGLNSRDSNVSFEEEKAKAFIEFVLQSFQAEPDWIVHAHYIEGGDKYSYAEIEIHKKVSGSSAEIFIAHLSPKNEWSSLNDTQSALLACWGKWLKAEQSAFMDQATYEEDGDFLGLSRKSVKKFFTEYASADHEWVEEVVAKVEATALKLRHAGVVRPQKAAGPVL